MLFEELESDGIRKTPPINIDAQSNQETMIHGQDLPHLLYRGRVIRLPNWYMGACEAQIFFLDSYINNSLSYKQGMEDIDNDK